jgi:peptide deformylase
LFFNEKEEKEIHTEGCLSVPNFYAKVERFNHIVVEALDENGYPFTLEARRIIILRPLHK